MNSPPIKQRIICLVCATFLILIVASFFVVGAFADVRADIPAFGGFYPMVVTGDNFYIVDTFYVLPKSPDVYSSFICSSLSCYNGVISLTTTVYKPEELSNDVYVFEYNPSTHFLVGNFDNSLVDANFAPESNTSFFTIYPYTINPGQFLRCVPCRGESYYSNSNQFNFYEYSNGVYNLITETDSIIFQDTTRLNVLSGMVTYDYLLSLSRHNNYYVSPVSSIQFESFSEDMFRFYCYFVPEQFPDLPEEDITGESIPQVILTIVDGFFEGLSTCYIFPGISIMTVIYCWFGVLLFRYIIKLLAGG